MNEDKLLEMAKKLVEMMNDTGEEDIIFELLIDEGYDEDDIEDFIEECYK